MFFRLMCAVMPAHISITVVDPSIFHHLGWTRGIKRGCLLTANPYRIATCMMGIAEVTYTLHNLMYDDWRLIVAA